MVAKNRKQVWELALGRWELRPAPTSDTYVFSEDVMLVFCQPLPALGRAVVEQVKSWYTEGHRDAVLSTPLSGFPQLPW